MRDIVKMSIPQIVLHTILSAYLPCRPSTGSLHLTHPIVPELDIAVMPSEGAKY